MGKNGTEPALAPNSVEAEEAVLGSILIDADRFFDASGFLDPAHFFIVRNAWVYEAMQALASRGEQLDYITVLEQLRQVGRLDEIGGPAYLTYLINNTPSSLFTETYGRIVERAAVRRQLLAAAGEIATLAQSDTDDVTVILDQAVAAVTGVQLRGQRDASAPVSVIVQDVIADVEAARAQNRVTGLPTGFESLDRLLGGMQKSDLLIVAGRPGMGKTSWLTTVALRAARRFRARIYVASLEMSQKQLTQRFISADTGLPSDTWRRQMDDAAFSRFLEGAGRIGELGIEIDDTAGLSISQLTARVTRHYNQHGLDLLIVDYLQLMRGVGENRVQQIGDISRGLKTLARKLDVPVLAAAQLSRAVESRGDKHPMLSDLRESGDIENDADVVMFVYRDDYYNPVTDRPNQADIIIAKHRNGPTGTVPLYFRRDLTRFDDLTRSVVDVREYDT